MELFWTLLPIYIFGNGHCLGMCGPLVMLIGRHRYSWAYFIGRAISFSLAALCSFTFGWALQTILIHYFFPGAYSILIGLALVLLPVITFFKAKLDRRGDLKKGILGQYLSTLALQNRIWPLFLFGFATAFIPCGQSLVVFSACSMAPSALAAGLNGLAFALLTSPSLFLAMNIHKLFNKKILKAVDITRYLTLGIGCYFIWKGFLQALT